MITVSLIGGDEAARAEVRRILERAGITVVGEREAVDDIDTSGDVLVRAVMASNGTSDSAVREALTAREREVLTLLADGLSNRRAAERLGISEHTVKFHVTSIYGKLGASSRAELIRRAARRGLIAI
jgi:DNA-binding NarL/FixJ family response regulator